MTATSQIAASFDPTDPEKNQIEIPLAKFLEMRHSSPVFWVEQPASARAGFLESAGSGYWAISKHADVSAISKNVNDFSAQENTVFIRFSPEIQREEVELQQVMLVNQDPPQHTSTRQIISRGFTPKSIGNLEEVLYERAHKIVDAALAKGSGDFVEDIAAELPLQAIADLIGAPMEDRKKLFDWSNVMMSYDDPDVEGDPVVAAAEIIGYSMELAEKRKFDPQDDIVTKLIQPDLPGGAMTGDEFGYFFILLTVAGNETTRNAITHGMHAFFENPDQWELFKKERPKTAVDEIIRWATPITVFQRTALNDVEINGQQIKKGERVGLFYASANHDEDVFSNPEVFDISRNPNPHLSFGGHGAHYCIGANLARLEVEVMFNVIADKLPNISQLAEPKRLRHAWVNGIKELTVKYN